jgi:DNA-binding response OmpR family regulator
MILDNSDDILEMLTDVFGTEEFKLSTCNSQNSLIERLNSEIPDLMIIEVRQPEVIENSICNDLRKRNALKNIPMIVTSTQHAITERYKEFSAAIGLEKPFEIATLMSKVKRLLAMPVSAA